MNISLILYNDEIEVASWLIRQFWKVHNNYEESIEESYEEIKLWTKEGHKLYLIKNDNEFIGFAHLGSRGCKVDWLEDIFILSEHQNKGIGTNVITLIENIVRKYSDSLYIETAARNEKAIRLYKKIGYDCLNTITVRKDFDLEKYESIRKEKIYGLDFDIKRNKNN